MLVETELGTQSSKLLSVLNEHRGSCLAKVARGQIQTTIAVSLGLSSTSESQRGIEDQQAVWCLSRQSKIRHAMMRMQHSIPNTE